MSENNGKLSSGPTIAPSPNEDDQRDAVSSETFELPDLAGSGTLDRLIDTAKDYARQALGENTNAAYKADWAHFSSWCRRQGAEPIGAAPCPDPQMIGLYIADCASPAQSALRPLFVSTIERRLSGLAWHYQQRGFSLDRKDRHIATVLAGIKRKHARPPLQKEAILAEDILDMIATLSFGLRDQRDRAILLIGYAGGLRRSEIVSLDFGRDDTLFSGHSLRAGLATSANVDECYIQKQLGHASPEMTRRYQRRRDRFRVNLTKAAGL